MSYSRSAALRSAFAAVAATNPAITALSKAFSEQGIKEGYSLTASCQVWG
jgi:hypothetical protein